MKNPNNPIQELPDRGDRAPRSLREIVICTGFILLILCLLGFIVATFVPLLKSASDLADKGTIRDYLEEESGIQGYLALAALQILQVISVFLPGAAVQIAGGLVYGLWPSFFLCFGAFSFANVMMFYLCRHSRFLSRLIPEKSRSVVVVSSWLNSNDPGFMAMLAYMIPGIPNGFVPYVAARTQLRAREFLRSVMLGSVLQIFLQCALGEQLDQGNWGIVLGLIALMLILIALLYRHKNSLIRHRDRFRAFWKRKR